ncbi:hypothetical protein RFI_08251 [Reticulomyxa filosa]|uniref:Uncharacterized protein n=1 Tax=Reticulomyxa filosa TaxID=46433 RepID=X6NSJ0_RETFI|nr:hypothetical protein RFI_08251 [Reticulomyxa filosa]|eukprot:ETO28878.1 hypothetical protein RFI_08251 [Reticulomyxa filosa]
MSDINIEIKSILTSNIIDKRDHNLSILKLILHNAQALLEIKGRTWQSKTYSYFNICFIAIYDIELKFEEKGPNNWSLQMKTCLDKMRYQTMHIRGIKECNNIKILKIFIVCTLLQQALHERKEKKKMEKAPFNSLFKTFFFFRLRFADLMRQQFNLFFFQKCHFTENAISIQQRFINNVET